MMRLAASLPSRSSSDAARKILALECALKRAIGNVMLFLELTASVLTTTQQGIPSKSDYIFTCDSQKYELFLILQNNECVF